MSDYARPCIPGASFFFTLTPQARGCDFLTREIFVFHSAVAQTRADRPFRIDAWVVRPDHVHAVWTLPAEMWIIRYGGA
jgi:putative transposase